MVELAIYPHQLPPAVRSLTPDPYLHPANPYRDSPTASEGQLPFCFAGPSQQKFLKISTSTADDHFSHSPIEPTNAAQDIQPLCVLLPTFT